MREARAKPDGWLAGAFVVLTLCTLVPLIGPRFLPLHDWPLHLAALSVLRHHGDAAWGYARYYELARLPLPYWGFFAPGWLLATVMPVEQAGRWALALGVVALPPAVALFLHRMGRSPWLGLFAFPFAFHACLRWGFAAFTCALPLAFLALWALDGFLAAPSGRRGPLLGGLALALFFAHVLPWLFFLCAAPILCASHGWRPRRIAAAAGAILPSLVIALAVFSVAARRVAAVSGRGFDGTFRAPGATFAELPRQLVYQLPGTTSVVLVGSAVASLVLFALGWRRRRPDGPGWRHRRPDGPGWRHRLLAVALLALLLPFVSPVSVRRPVDLWFIGDRFIAVGALLLLVLPRVELTGARRAWMLPVVLLAAFYPLRLARAFYAFGERLAGLERVAEQRIPKGASCLTLIYTDGGDARLDPQALPLKNAHAYLHLWRGGYDPYAMSNGFPMKTRPGRALPAPPWRMPGAFSLDEHGRRYDFIVTYGERRDHLIVGAADPSQAPLIAVDGEWRVYRPAGERR